MTAYDFMKLLEYIRENNSWGYHMYDVVHIRHRKAIKYVDACYDTRTGEIWQIKFRSCIGTTGTPQEINFRIENESDIKRIYDWLDERIE